MSRLSANSMSAGRRWAMVVGPAFRIAGVGIADAVARGAQGALIVWPRTFTVRLFLLSVSRAPWTQPHRPRPGSGRRAAGRTYQAAFPPDRLLPRNCFTVIVSLISNRHAGSR